MILLSICDNADLLSAIKLANSVVDIFKIAVPILLILSIWFSIMGAKKTNNSELIKDAKKSAIFKVIAAVLIFIVPMIFNLTFKSDKYSECLSGVNDKNIAISYSDKVSYLAFVAYEENDSEKLKQAEEYLSKISDVNNNNLLEIFPDIVEKTNHKEKGVDLFFFKWKEKIREKS